MLESIAAARPLIATRGRPSADARDVALGARIRARRLQIGMTQERLGDALGVSFQQVQKYEKGANRVAGNRLVDIATALGCTVSDLHGSAAVVAVPGFLSPEAREVAAAFDRLGPAERAAIGTLLRGLAPTGAVLTPAAA